MRELGAHGADDAHGMTWAIQEVGISEGDVGRANLDLPPDVLQDSLLRKDKVTALVDRDDGTMEAVMQAAAAGLHVPNQVPVAVALKMSVLAQHGQQAPAWHRK